MRSSITMDNDMVIFRFRNWWTGARVQITASDTDAARRRVNSLQGGFVYTGQRPAERTSGF